MYANAGKQFPVLKGKAAEIRHFPQALLHAFQKVCGDGSNSEEKLMIAMLEAAIKVEKILDDHAGDFRLPPDAQKVFEHSIMLFHQANTSLGTNFFHPRGVGLFNHVVKYHYAMHIALISRYINPRVGWCYAGEDFMHTVKILSQSSQRGTPPHHLQIRKSRILNLERSCWDK